MDDTKPTVQTFELFENFNASATHALFQNHPQFLLLSQILRRKTKHHLLLFSEFNTELQENFLLCFKEYLANYPIQFLVMPYQIESLTDKKKKSLIKKFDDFIKYSSETD